MAEGVEVGRRIRELRTEHGMSLSDVAGEADISKAYLSQIETGQVKRPSAQVLFAIASALGTTVAALLGRAPVENAEALLVPQTLRDFATEAGLTEDQVQMLAGIRYRGRQPRKKEDWGYLYESIRRSVRGTDSVR